LQYHRRLPGAGHRPDEPAAAGDLYAGPAVTWQSDVPPDPVRLAPGGWMRLAWRVPLIGGITFGGLVLLLVLRLVERPLFGLHRPWTPFITQGVCRAALALMGMKVTVV